MTDRMMIFCDEYLKDNNLNQTEAYLKAYPNVKDRIVAKAAATRLMKRADVKEYIDKRLEEIRSKNTADIAEVMEYLTSVMRGKSESEVVVVEGTGEGCSEARRIIKNPDEKERLRAAELLGKRFGMFTDKVQAELVVPIFEGEDELED